MSVRTEKKGSVWTIVLDRPEAKNAVNRDHAEALAEAFRAFEAADEAHVAVLFGEGGTFCAGADLKAVASGEGINRLEPHGDGPMGISRMQLNKPVIAAIAGYAVAGGLELALWCDLRVVEDDAVLGVFCRKWGVPLIDGGTFRLPKIIGLGRALDLILTGRDVGPEEALQMGLVSRVVPQGTAREAAEALAHQIAVFPQLCLRADRKSAYQAFDSDEEAAILGEFNRGAQVVGVESVEGAKRFANKNEGTR